MYTLYIYIIYIYYIYIYSIYGSFLKWGYPQLIPNSDPFRLIRRWNASARSPRLEPAGVWCCLGGATKGWSETKATKVLVTMYIYRYVRIYKSIYLYIILLRKFAGSYFEHHLATSLVYLVMDPAAMPSGDWENMRLSKLKKPCCSVHQPQPPPQTSNRSGPSFLSGDWSHLKNPNSPCYDRSSLATHGPHVALYRSNIFGYPKGW